MIKLYATYGGLKDLEPKKHKDFAGNLQMVWTKVRDETGKEIKGDIHSNRAMILNKMQPKKGNRYVITCKEFTNNKILYPTNICHTNKNPRCSLMRRFEDDFYFIKGKFKGKWLSKIDKDEINGYLLYLGKNTNNEATIINVLDILKRINE